VAITCCLSLRFSDPRDRHSFPTRRSSDLQFTALFYGRGATNVTAFRRALDALPFAATDDAEQSFFSSRSDSARATASRRRRAHRSEEHTSELQSRENLVCRLLLEKKKTQI